MLLFGAPFALMRNRSTGCAKERRASQLVLPYGNTFLHSAKSTLSWGNAIVLSALTMSAVPLATLSQLRKVVPLAHRMRDTNLDVQQQILIAARHQSVYGGYRVELNGVPACPDSCFLPKGRPACQQQCGMYRLMVSANLHKYTP